MELAPICSGPRRPRRFAVAALATLFALGAAGSLQADSSQAIERGHFTAGEQVAHTLTLVTGVPISPLLGVSGLGAWRWWQTPPAMRPHLPWYARPWFWVSGLSVALLFALNTTIGALVPGLKKPMDFVEEHENRFSTLLAAPVVLLEVRRALDAAGLLPDAVAARPLVEAGAAALADGTLARLLAGVGYFAVYATIFLAVFLAFHAIQVLIAFSPSVTLDLTLRGFRLAMLIAAGLTAAVDPWFGAIWAAILALGCLLIAGWSFRLTTFGALFSWEIVTGRDGTADPATDRLTLFSGRALEGIPVRTFGRLEPIAGDPAVGWQFRWRPWLILPSRTRPLPDSGTAGTALVRGAISPRLVRTGPLRERAVGRFPPRFRGREEGLASRLGVPEVLDGRIVRGLRASWRWLKELVLGIDRVEPAAG